MFSFGGSRVQSCKAVGFSWKKPRPRRFGSKRRWTNRAERLPWVPRSKKSAIFPASGGGKCWSSSLFAGVWCHQQKVFGWPKPCILQESFIWNLEKPKLSGVLFHWWPIKTTLAAWHLGILVKSLSAFQLEKMDLYPRGMYDPRMIQGNIFIIILFWTCPSTVTKTKWGFIYFRSIQNFYHPGSRMKNLSSKNHEKSTPSKPPAIQPPQHPTPHKRRRVTGSS